MHANVCLPTLDGFASLLGEAIDEMSFDLREKRESLIKKYVEAIQVDMKVNNAITRCRHTDCWFFKSSRGVYFPTGSGQVVQGTKGREAQGEKTPPQVPVPGSWSWGFELVQGKARKSPKSGKKAKGKKAKKSKA